MTKEELKEHCKRQVECCEMWARNNGGEPHFQGNPYELKMDVLMAHGSVIARGFYPLIPCNACFTDDYCIEALDYIREYLDEYAIEGLVFWFDGEPVCKIKRTDFGLKWPV